jgi:hypothetical protein
MIEPAQKAQDTLEADVDAAMPCAMAMCARPCVQPSRTTIFSSANWTPCAAWSHRATRAGRFRLSVPPVRSSMTGARRQRATTTSKGLDYSSVSPENHSRPLRLGVSFTPGNGVKGACLNIGCTQSTTMATAWALSSSSPATTMNRQSTGRANSRSTLRWRSGRRSGWSQRSISALATRRMGNFLLPHTKADLEILRSQK